MKLRALVLFLGLGAVAAALLWARPALSEGSRRTPPPLKPDDSLSDFASRLAVGAARRHENLTLFLVTARGAAVPRVGLTLDQAVARDLIEVTELKDSDVNRLRVHSAAKEPVFAMAGEMLRGGKQDRILADDLVIPAGAELVVPVFCVEHGRWSGAAGRGERFSTGHSLASAEVRGAGRAGQGAVWSRVEESQARLRAPSTTGALRSVHDSEEVRQHMKPYLSALSDLPDEDAKACGVVAMVDHEMLAADLFSSPSLFRQLWPDLLEAYVIDALEQVESDHPRAHPYQQKGRPDPQPVERWLSGMKRAERTPRDTPGAGTLYDVSARDFRGRALVWDRGVVHLEMFPAAPTEPDDPHRLDFRRDRLQGR